MNEKDDIILEYLDRIYPSAEPPRTLYFNLGRWDEELGYSKRTSGGFSYDTLRNRIDRLQGLGLIEVAREKNRHLAISDEGRSYLRGEIDAADLED